MISDLLELSEKRVSVRVLWEPRPTWPLRFLGTRGTTGPWTCGQLGSSYTSLSQVHAVQYSSLLKGLFKRIQVFHFLMGLLTKFQVTLTLRGGYVGFTVVPCEPSTEQKLKRQTFSIGT